MDAITIPALVDIFRSFGPFGIVVLFWYMDSKVIHKILQQYKNDMVETRRMYEDNVKLVRGYEDLAGDLKDIIVMSTQHLTRLSEQIAQNQYCPFQRLEKKKIEVEQ